MTQISQHSPSVGSSFNSYVSGFLMAAVLLLSAILVLSPLAA